MSALNKVTSSRKDRFSTDGLLVRYLFRKKTVSRASGPGCSTFLRGKCSATISWVSGYFFGGRGAIMDNASTGNIKRAQKNPSQRNAENGCRKRALTLCSFMQPSTSNGTTSTPPPPPPTQRHTMSPEL